MPLFFFRCKVSIYFHCLCSLFFGQSEWSQRSENNFVSSLFWPCLFISLLFRNSKICLSSGSGRNGIFYNSFIILQLYCEREYVESLSLLRIYVRHLGRHSSCACVCVFSFAWPPFRTAYNENTNYRHKWWRYCLTLTAWAVQSRICQTCNSSVRRTNQDVLAKTLENVLAIEIIFLFGFFFLFFAFCWKMSERKVLNVSIFHHLHQRFSLANRVKHLNLIFVSFHSIPWNHP